MNSSEISCEEYYIENKDCIEYLDDVNEESDSEQICFEHDTAKCGEVMVGYQGEFTFICDLCKQHFIDLRSFGSHIRDLHLNQTTLSTISIEVDRGKDPVYEEKSTIPVSAQPEVILEVLPLVPASVPSPTQKKVELVIMDAVASSDCKVEAGSKDPISSGQEKPRVAISSDSSKVGKFACTICGCSYQARSSIGRHMRKRHPPIPVSATPTCKYCDKEFDDKVQLQTHVSMHTGKNRFVCPLCPKAFGSRHRRQAHVNTHTGERPYQCSRCAKAFASPDNLVTHERAHLNIRKFSCSYCGKRFGKKTDKDRHERSHTGEMPYQCEECGKRFLSIVGLTGHSRRHKNIKPYACMVCSKAFYTSSRLKEHSLMHTNERPYHCNVCGKNYRRNKSLRSHMELHSKENNYICDICGEAFLRRTSLYLHQRSHGEKL